MPKSDITAILKRANDVGSGTDSIVTMPLAAVWLPLPGKLPIVEPVNNQSILPLRFGDAEISRRPFKIESENSSSA
jgi:hypothetical protein